MARNVIIDTDPGIDDALALLLALRSPELKVLAITTVNGNVPVEVTTRNVFTIYSLLPAGTPQPTVARGADRPLQKDPVWATSFHGQDGLGNLTNIESPGGAPLYAPLPAVLSPRNAADEILHQVRNGDAAVTLIALGPLTNVAAAIRKDAATMACLERIVLMGGAVTVAGNMTPAAEFNLYVDPHAAEVVFTSGIPLTMVGLDVTRRAHLTPDMLRPVDPTSPGNIARFVGDCTAEPFTSAVARQGEAQFPLHDPLAVGVVIRPDFVRTEPMHVAVDTGGGVADGMTVADRRPLKPHLKSAPNVDVCLEVDARGFADFLLRRLYN